MQFDNFTTLTTDHDTHEPWKWAEVMLDDLVPTIKNCSARGLQRIVEAKVKLRPHVIALLAAIRAAERDGLQKFSSHDNEAAALTYKHYHGLVEPNGLHFHTLHKQVNGQKIRSSSDWAEQFVQNICKVAEEIDGNIGSNSMRDEVYRCLENWINAMQTCERSHHVTSQNLHQTI